MLYKTRPDAISIRSADCAYCTFGGVSDGSSIVTPSGSEFAFCDVVSVSFCEVVSDVLDVSDEVSDGVSVADVVSVSLDVSVLSVAFGVDFTSLPSEVTVLVVPSGEVTVEVVLSAVGSGVGAAKENDSGITVINAASSKEINLFFFIIVSLPP